MRNSNLLHLAANNMSIQEAAPKKEKVEPTDEMKEMSDEGK